MRFPDSPGVQAFLEEHWQKKPLVLKAAFPDFKDPISAEELAGLACEETAEARLVFTQGGNWQMQQGPFREEDFRSLPAKDWTLLVQAVDHWFPQLGELARAFDFIPAWRIDDIMVSYATPGAGVGPHFDYYDVFIIQGEGHRHWQLGRHCSSRDPIDSRSGLKILQDFETEESFELSTGDLLYIPPGWSHWGTALDNNLSYSVGFRAPSQAEMLAAAAATVCARLSEDQRYSDPELRAISEPGLLPAELADKLAKQLGALLNNKALLIESFGRQMTESRYPESAYLPDEAHDAESFSLLLQTQGRLQKHPASRFAYTLNPEGCICFADGEAFTLAGNNENIRQLLQALGNPARQTLDDLQQQYADPECTKLLLNLYNQGSLIDLETE